MASFFSVFVFFIYSMLMFHPEIENGFLGNVSISSMVIAEIILVLFSWFFIYYSLKAFLEVRTKEFSILLHLGMERKQLGKLIILETIIIGSFSIFIGILFGYSFSKFFFMVVKELLLLDELPLYLSWEPFVLTIAVYLSAFIVISMVSVFFKSEDLTIYFLKNYQQMNVNASFSKVRGLLGIILIVIGYILAIISTFKFVLGIALFIPIFLMIGTYFFFTDTTQYFLEIFKRKKKFYWKNARMLSIAEQTSIMRNDGKIYFIVTIVTTMAFLCVGLLASLSSYTSQYDKLNPLGLIYKGLLNNPFEEEHIATLRKELEDKGLSYHLTKFVIYEQTSSNSSNKVEVLRESDVNHLLYAYGYPMVNLEAGEGMFIGNTEENIERLGKQSVNTVLMESNIPLTINTVYPKVIFPSSIISINSIIISDEDFKKIPLPNTMNAYEELGYHLYTFDIPQWIETVDVGLSINNKVVAEQLKKEYKLPYYFENAGLNYSLLLSTYSLLTLIGLLVAAVFLLAAGSFVYFKLHSNLEVEKRKFDVLKRMGLTEGELKKNVTKHLLPQFFMPWGLALLHSLFAFIFIQYNLKNYVNISIVKELVFALIFLVFIQVVYFFLIRWRYISNVRE